MDRFAWVGARTVAEAAAAASTTVAEAMTAAAVAPAAVVKAGGIDLLDLLKEKPAGAGAGRQPARRPGPRCDHG
jgi:hypothetical protein